MGEGVGSDECCSHHLRFSAVNVSPSGNLITGGSCLGWQVMTFLIAASAFATAAAPQFQSKRQRAAPHQETLGQLGSLGGGGSCPCAAAAASCSARIVSHVSFSVPNLPLTRWKAADILLRSVEAKFTCKCFSRVMTLNFCFCRLRLHPWGQQD